MKHLRYKALALVIAIFLWVLATGTSSVERSFDIPVVLDSVPEGLVVLEKSVDRINVNLRGKRTAITKVERGELEYLVDLSGAQAPDFLHEVNASILLLPHGAKVVSRSPSHIRVHLGNYHSVRVPVKVGDVAGNPDPNVEIEEIRVLRPQNVKVGGERGEVMTVRQVQTEEIDVTGISETTTRKDVGLILRGSNVWLEEKITVELQIRVRPKKVEEAE